MLERLEDLGVPEPWRLAEPLAVAGVDEAWLAEVAELAGPATGAALRWVAASLTARSLAADLHDSASRMGDLVTAIKSYAYMDRGGAGRGRRPRGPRDDARRPRPQAQAHLDRGRARLRPLAAAADRPRLRAQPGVDQPHRQRHRRAGRERHPHHRDRARRPVRARRRRRRRPRHPGRGPAARARPLLHHQAGGPGDRAWAWTPRARSSRSTTAGRWASTPARAARPSTCGCPSRARCADLPPSGHGDLHSSGHDHGDPAARRGGRLRGLPARRAASGCTCASA